MKKLISTLIIILFSLSGLFAQQHLMENEVSQKAAKAFHEKYPTAIVVYWTKNENGYQVQYKMDEDLFDAFFAEEGAWLKTEYSIDSEELPDAVVNAKQNTKYKTWDIGNVRVIEMPDKEKTYKLEMYDMEYNQAIIMFDPKGNIVK